MAAGSLIVVGTGFHVAGQVTAETLTCLEKADKLFHLILEPATRHWLESVNPTAESLDGCYVEGRPRSEAYAAMVERLLAPVRRGLRVCAAFYGHPGVFVDPSHAAIRRARAEGFPARMLPGISAEDCLFADLGVDPGKHGCQSFEATDFLLRRRRFDPASSLVLWQVGAIGLLTASRQGKSDAAREKRRRAGLAVLADVLREHYPAGHEAILYEASPLPLCPPEVRPVALAGLAAASVRFTSTLYVPPGRKAPVDPAMRRRLGLK